MKPEVNIFTINVFFLIITIITFVRFLFFQGYLSWLCLIIAIWIVFLVSIERAKKGRYHDRLNKRKIRR